MLLSDIVVKHYHTIYYWNYFCETEVFLKHLNCVKELRITEKSKYKYRLATILLQDLKYAVCESDINNIICTLVGILWNMQ